LVSFPLSQDSTRFQRTGKLALNMEAFGHNYLSLGYGLVNIAHLDLKGPGHVVRPVVIEARRIGLESCLDLSHGGQNFPLYFDLFKSIFGQVG